MSNAIDESLTEVLQELPGRVSNKLILGVVIETRTTVRNDIEKLSSRVDTLEQRLALVEQTSRESRENPSLIWLVRYHPKTFISLMAKIVLLIALVAGASNLPQLVEVLATLGG